MSSTHQRSTATASVVLEGVKAFAKDLKQLPAFPAVALRMIEVAGNRDSSLKEISRLIESDQSIAARVLRVANSACFGAPRQVSSIDQATTFLGLDFIRCLGLSVVASRLLVKAEPNPDFNLGALWHHSVACAIASKLLAERTGYPKPEECFVAGLLHDLGKLVLSHWDMGLYQRVVGNARASRTSLLNQEKAELGIDHAELAGVLLEDWNFPSSLVQAVSGHHRQLSDLTREPQEDLALVLKCANSMCHNQRFGESGNPVGDLDTKQLGQATGLSNCELKRLAAEVVRRFDEISEILGAEGGTPELYLSALSRANLELSQLYVELRQKEEHLRRSQKLEAVGHLAGGLAHDFNNLLTVITGYGDLLREAIRDDERSKQHVDMIADAARRATKLTGQLLAFSRKQMLEPKVLDLNSVLADMSRLLRSLVCKRLHLATLLEPELNPVKIDPGQIEQVIMNLVVNARDAMPDGGKLTIETANIKIDRKHARELGSMKAGYYTVLAVHDTGKGMDGQTQARIFEPFFTTKENGTGMGLATVYGIVRQSGGHIYFESEFGKGTTFKVYLPGVEAGITEAGPCRRTSRECPGCETVLVVEDEVEIRSLIREVLEKNGYTVLTAIHVNHAIQMAEQHQGRIDLLLTDIVMPQLSGFELAQTLRSRHSDIRVLYISGYASDLPRRALGPEDHFLQKPFRLDELADKVRSLLRPGSPN